MLAEAVEEVELLVAPLEAEVLRAAEAALVEALPAAVVVDVALLVVVAVEEADAGKLIVLKSYCKCKPKC